MPFDLISFSSGLGYLIAQEIQTPHPLDESIDFNKVSMSIYRVPLQFNYHIFESLVNTDCYLKAVFTNGILVDKIRQYGNDELINKDKVYLYIPSIGIGIGSRFLKDKSLGIILEGMVEKHLRENSFKVSTWYSIKIGLVI